MWHDVGKGNLTEEPELDIDFCRKSTSFSGSAREVIWKFTALQLKGVSRYVTITVQITVKA